MRGFTITFTIALGIVCAVVAFSKESNRPNNLNNVTLAKTYIQTDSANRTLSELTMVCENGIWSEKYKRVYSYTEGRVFDLTYKFENGHWNQISNTIRTYQDASLLSKVSYTLQESDSIWVETEKQSYADLSYDPENRLHDMEFDLNGNLLTDAVYEWSNEQRGKGISKEEFGYTKQGELSKRTQYAWHNGEWKKNMVADMHYISSNNQLANNIRR